MSTALRIEKKLYSKVQGILSDFR